MTTNQVRAYIEETIKQNGAGSITAIKLRTILLGIVENLGGGSGDGAGYGFQGPQGAQGKIGIGYDGNDGAQGRQGRAGSDGTDGVQGRQGKMGAAGQNGNDGYQGRQGRAGADGIGAQGQMGVQGPMGVGGSGSGSGSGTQGQMGVQGLAGGKGDKGDKGDTGAQGPMGPSGSGSGGSSSGSQGPQGIKGDGGSQGPRGSNGENGAQGPQGVGIDRIETYETGEAISEGGGVKTYRNVDIYLTNGSTSPAASFSFLESDSSSSGQEVIIDNDTPLLKRSVRTIEDRVSYLEETVDDMINYATLTLNITSAPVSGGKYTLDTYYTRGGNADSGYTYTDPVDFWTNRAGGTTLYAGAMVDSGGSQTIDFKPIVIYNNYEITEAFDGVYQKKVLKGEKFNIKIFANGHLMVNRDFTIYNNDTEDIKMDFSGNCYLVLVPNKENAEIQIYQPDTILKTEEIHATIGSYAQLSWDRYAVTSLSYAEGASMKKVSLSLNKYKKQIGWYNYTHRYIGTQFGGYYSYGDTGYTSESFTALQMNPLYENIILPVDLNGESNVSKYTLTIGEPSPTHAVLTLHRGWHEALNEKINVNVGDTYEVYEGEQVSLHADTRYIDGNNYYPWGSHATISGNTTMTVEMPKEDLYCYKFPASNINDFHANYGFTNSAATAGEYGGWVNEENTPNGDGYYKLIYPDGYSTIFFIYSSGYVPVVKELMFGEHSHNSVVDTTMASAASPYLNIEVLKRGFNPLQHDADGEEHVYDGYQRIVENSDGSADVWLYCAYVYNSYVKEMVREPNSTLEFSVYSSSQFELTATHRLPAERWSIVTPSNPKGSYYDRYGFYGNDGMYVKFILTNMTVAPNGYLGDITIANEEGLSKVFHIYCKWFHAES